MRAQYIGRVVLFLTFFILAAGVASFGRADAESRGASAGSA